MKIEVRSWHTVSRRTEDSLPNCPEKKKFEKHIDAYFIKIMRCNTYWEILKSRKSTKEDFILTYNYAPAFWNAVIYSLQMGIITDLVSFLSNDEASLSKYFENIVANKDKIFTRKFYETILSVPNQHKFSFFYQNGNNGEKGDVKFNFLTYMQEVDIINNYIL